jgi:hypothetical protein
MTELVTGSEEKTLIPFLKLGEFNAENYPTAAKAKKAQETEAKYGTIRVQPGKSFSGEITGIYDTKFGAVMYLKEVSGLGDGVTNVKMNVTKNISFALDNKKKGVGDKISVTYEGVKSLSKKDPTIVGHSCKVD